MIPISGSAYTYSYATMGELIAWIIGWDLVLEYTVAATTVSISWSRYLVVFLESIGIELPQLFTACPWDGGLVNIPAAVIVVIISLFLIRGTEESAVLNGIIVFLKVAVILLFIVLGWQFIRTENYLIFLKIQGRWENSDYLVFFVEQPLFFSPFLGLMRSVRLLRRQKIRGVICRLVF